MTERITDGDIDNILDDNQTRSSEYDLALDLRDCRADFKRCSDHAATLGVENDELRARIKPMSGPFQRGRQAQYELHRARCCKFVYPNTVNLEPSCEFLAQPCPTDYRECPLTKGGNNE